jgi:general secretion pathway protein J
MFINSNFTRSSGNKRGFTLLEILIAVFILAVVLSTVYAAYTGTFRITKDSDEAREVYGMARNTMDRLLKDIGALSTTDGKFNLISRPSEVGRADFTDLTFISRSHLSLSENEIQSGLAEITYYVDEDETKEGYRLMRRDVLYAGASNEERNQGGFVLCERLHSLTYRFINAAGRESDSWDSASDAEGQKNRAPAMIYIELKLTNEKDRDQPYTFATKVFVPLSTLVTPGL